MTLLSLMSYSQNRLIIREGIKPVLSVDSAGVLTVTDSLKAIKELIKVIENNRKIKQECYDIAEIVYYMKNILQYIDVNGNVIDRKKYNQAIKLFNEKYSK